MTTFALALTGRTFRSLRRHRNYRLFFAGQLVSVAGAWMQNVALAWLVLQLSGSPFAVGALAFCRFVPFTVFGLVAGSVVDRFDTRRVVMAAQGAAMALSVALALVALVGTSSLALVYALAALGGLVLVVDAPARQALTFEMVGREELPNAVALNASLFNASRVLGPAIAGVVIATVGTAACFAINAVSFLAVLGALAAMRAQELHPVAKERDRHVLRGAVAGLRWAWSSPDTRVVLTVLTAIGALGFNFHVLVPLLAAALDARPEEFGLLSAAFGAGALVGALAAASFRRARWRTFLGGAAGFSVCLLALGPVHSVPLAGALLVVLGICFTLLAATASALVQLAAPEALRGRVVGLYMFAFVGLAPVGGLLAGALAEAGGTALAFGVAGGAGLAVTAWAARARLAAVTAAA